MNPLPSRRLKSEIDAGQRLLFDPFEAPRAAAPDADLEGLFDELNHRFFGGRLAARVEWSVRLVASAGDCDQARRRVRISRSYHGKRPEALRATLAHEMCHLLIPGHGAEFRSLAEPIAEALGVPWEDFRYAETWADLKRYRYVYACPACGMELPSRKRRRISCASCSGAEFNEEFRMILAESRAKPGPILLSERPARGPRQ